MFSYFMERFMFAAAMTWAAYVIGCVILTLIIG